MPPVWLLAMMSALGPLSTDLYLPALPAIGVDFAASPAAVQWTLSGFMLGFAPAMLVIGPLADRFGRRPVVLGGTMVFLLASLACALAPAVGPVLGGLLVVASGWRTCFLVLAFVALANLAAMHRLLRETAPALDARATELATLLAAMREFAASRAFRLHTAVATAGYSALFAFISGGTYVVQQGLGLSPFGFALCFGAVAFAYFLGSMVSRVASPRLGTRRMIVLGAGWSALVGLAGFAGLVLAGPSLATVVLPMVLIMVGFAQTQPNAMAGAVGPFPHMAGRASSALGFVQWGLAAFSGLVLASMLDMQGLVLSAFMLFWLALALLAALKL